MYEAIIGRKAELQLLQTALLSSKAELIAVTQRTYPVGFYQRNLPLWQNTNR